MPPQPNDSFTPTQTATACPWYQPLCKVTPVSKYLAMLVFIILPFIGAYVGYQLAGEEVEVLVNVPVVTPQVVTESDSEVKERELFSATPQSGGIPMKVRFTSSKYSTHDASEAQHYVDFGDNTERGRITCLTSTGVDLSEYKCHEWGIEHTYESIGVFSADLIEVAGCFSGEECSQPNRPEVILDTIEITVN